MPPPQLSSSSAHRRCRDEVRCEHRLATRGDISRGSTRSILDEWRKQRKCTDLISLRLPLPASALDTTAYYIKHDTASAHLRARLRLNRSNLNDSRHRRGMIASAACRCGNPRETPMHLLDCPQYAANDFLSHPLNGDSSLLLSDLSTVRRRSRSVISARQKLPLARAARASRWHLALLSHAHP